MYEILLGLNIVWELAGMYKAWTYPAAAVLAVLLVAALVRRAPPGRRALAMVAGLITGAVALFALPGATLADFGDMGYWIDWLTLAGLAVGAGVAAAIAAAGIYSIIGKPPA